VPFGRAGCPGASQSSGQLNENFSRPEVWLGGGCKFQRDGTSTRRNGGQVDAEWRLPSLVTTSVNFAVLLTLRTQDFHLVFLCIQTILDVKSGFLQVSHAAFEMFNPVFRLWQAGSRFAQH